ncbi:MAG: argininosuccinate lyase [Candidatus Omnitrophica bacterium]|nr:argininosuccinate lyase [Candidatus Omnitrophota bacterium]
MKKLWGGRFKKETDPALKCFSYSLLVDSELLEAELCVNEVYARMLAKTGLITAKEASRLVKGLKTIASNWKQGDERKYFERYEDIHTFVQQELERITGDVAKKIHTGRSRNDLVVTSTRLYLRYALNAVELRIRQAQKALVGCSARSHDLIIPGMTHLRKAQPVLLAHHLLAYVEMLEEDLSRIRDAKKRSDVLILGSGALSGSGLAIDRKFLAKELGFKKISANSMASVSDRGFITEVLSALAILWMHLSRLSEDFILWNSEWLRFVDLDDAFATGSSLMPQKKNPDVFELIRGRAGVIFGHLMALLTVQKGLPLAYNRDLQEDKPGLFDALSKTRIALEVLSKTLDTASFNREAMAKSVEEDALYATDILEYLVKKKMPFAQAHEIVGQVVSYAVENNRSMRDLLLEEWKEFSDKFKDDIFFIFDAQKSIAAKKTPGSTNPVMVKKEIARWQKILKS